MAGKHYSTSVFYQQGVAPYGPAPYWRFANWLTDLPEYVILDGVVSLTGTVIIPDELDNPVVYDIGFSCGGGKFLCRRSDGYDFTLDYGNPVNSLGYLGNPNTAPCVTYVPVLDLYTFEGPAKFSSHTYLRFSPFRQFSNDIETSDAPFSWHIGSLAFDDIRTIVTLTFTPKAMTGSFIFLYGDLGGVVTYTSDSVNLAQAIENRFPSTPEDTFTSSTGVSTEVLVSTDEEIVIRCTFDYPDFAIASVDGSNLVGGVVSLIETQEATGTAGNFCTLLPETAWNSFNGQGNYTAIPGTCKDSRYPDEPSGISLPRINDSPAIDLGQYGITYASIDFKHTTVFRTYRGYFRSNFQDDFIGYPGKGMYYPNLNSFNERYMMIPSNRQTISVTPVYL